MGNGCNERLPNLPSEKEGFLNPGRVKIKEFGAGGKPIVSK